MYVLFTVRVGVYRAVSSRPYWRMRIGNRLFCVVVMMFALFPSVIIGFAGAMCFTSSMRVPTALRDHALVARRIKFW